MHKHVNSVALNKILVAIGQYVHVHVGLHVQYVLSFLWGLYHVNLKMYHMIYIHLALNLFCTAGICSLNHTANRLESKPCYEYVRAKFSRWFYFRELLFPLQFMSIYSNDKISKIAKLP